MLSFPNAKINLGLHVTSKRPDGYHNLETCLYPVQWCDILEIIEGKEVEFNYTGLPINGDQKDNLCFKAYQLLRSVSDLPSIQLHLHKVIPMGAGLGGGSSDAAATLVTLNEKFGLGFNKDELMGFAAQLGSDCPFFIDNQPSLATGKGNRLQPTTVDLSGSQIIIVNPGLHIDTAQAYYQVNPKEPETPLIEILEQPIGNWKDALINDFESCIFTDYPQIQAIKKELYEMGAFYASMSGSGASVYGLFKEAPNLKAHFPNNYKCFETTL